MTWLELMRNKAYELAEQHSKVCTRDLHAYAGELARQGYQPGCWAIIFKDPRFHFLHRENFRGTTRSYHAIKKPQRERLQWCGIEPFDEPCELAGGWR